MITRTEEDPNKPVIGVLAIQGAVEEHIRAITKVGAVAKEIKLPHHFEEKLDGIILPGGESTTMAIIGERWGIFPLLKAWVEDGKPIWGTCAGMILLSNHAIKQKEGGQSLVGGLDVTVCRNFFGPQINSFEFPIPSSFLDDSSGPNYGEESDSTCTAVFIRAPAIICAGKDVQILATILAKPHRY